jgi:voltage-gated potassium channel
MTRARHHPGSGATRERLFTIIFRADTPAGQWFDMALIVAVLISVSVVLMSTVGELDAKYGRAFYAIEWFFTILFTIEYGLRLYCVKSPARYARSFYGVVDLLSVLPTYLGLILTGTAPMLVIRVLRILRLFKVMHMDRYVSDANILLEVLSASWRKTLVFVYTVLTVVVIFASLMYFIERDGGSFTSIPQSMYWAIVTLTTVGYGDIIPATPLGKVIASLIMITGYGIIAVPMGIFFSEFTEANKRRKQGRACPSCKARGHEPDAAFCKVCGTRLEEKAKQK